MSPAQLIDLAEAIADGAPIDWTRVQSTPATTASDVIVRARIVERVAQLHAALPAADSFSSSLHKSLAGVVLPGEAASSDQPITWGPLTIVERIGRGTFGDVYRAHDRRLNRSVALKLLRRRECVESAVIEEGHLMARVRHPNVVTVYGAERIDGRVGLWMELVEGPTLEQELETRGPFPADEIVKVGIDLARALGAVHRAGLLHRDLKAQNVMRDTDGRVLLTDFGAGRPLSDGAHTADGPELAGTPLYLAPEVLDGRPASPSSDIYSAGVLLHHLATASFPVRGRSLDDLRQAHKCRRPVQQLRADLPGGLCTVIDRTLSRDPADRFATAQELESALAASMQKRRVRGTWLAAVAVILLAALSAGLWAWRARVAVSPTFEPQDVVLITRFENRTGEPTLDGVMEYALEQELGRSRLFTIASRQRVADTLQLMRLPSDTRLDEAIGREVALRDGQIRALVSGRIARIGDAFSLDASVRKPADGVLLASVTVGPVAQGDLLRAVGRVALGLRERLGEATDAIAAQTASPLPKVTTASLKALQLYSQAVALQDAEGLFDGREKAAETLLREAVRQDPGFATAHRLLSIAVRLDGGRGLPNGSAPRLAEALTHIEHAVALANSVSQVERLVNEGELFGVQASMAEGSPEAARLRERAIAAFEAAIQLQPNHVDALICLTNNYMFAGQPNAILARRLADLRPTSVTWQMRAAVATLYQTPHDTALARRYVRRGETLPPSIDSASPATWIRLFEAADVWLRSDPSAALQAVDRVAAQIPSLPRQVADVFAPPLTHAYLTLGKATRTPQIIASAQPTVQRFLRARVAMAMEQPDVLRGILMREFPDVQDLATSASLLIESGLLDKAREGLAIAKARHFAPHFLSFFEGQIALAEGRPEQAIGWLDEAMHQTVASAQTMRTAIKLAEAWLVKGEPARAIHVLEQASLQRGWQSDPQSLPLTWGWHWLSMREKLSQLYRDAGRLKDAAVIESELQQLLSAADDDHPIKRRVAAQRSGASPRYP